MSKLISNAVIAQVRELIVEGKLSQREICKRLNVSRGTVTAVSMNRLQEREPSDDEEESERGSIERCKGCRGLVEMPCRLCRVRVLKYGTTDR